MRRVLLHTTPLILSLVAVGAGNKERVGLVTKRRYGMQPVARIGDQHDCPIHGKNRIAQVASRIKLDGKEIACVDDVTECGGKIISGSPVNKIDGRPIAHIGSRTSCGGLITTGSPTEKVRPG